MTKKTDIGRIALFHPGDMGHTVAGLLAQAGHEVVWCGEGRSALSRHRAGEAGLRECASMRETLAGTDLVISLCPPHAAVEVAREIAKLGFDGLYLDANAVAPATVRTVAAIVEAAGATLIDGGIAGSPPRKAGTTRLFLSGGQAKRIKSLFEGTDLEPVEVGPEIGAASATKICYAAWTKGTSALYLAIGALARAEGIEGALHAEWKRSQPDLIDRRAKGAERSLPKAWRFIGEMNEIAAAFAAQGLPAGFHDAAAEIYAGLATFKDDDGARLEDALDALSGKRG